MLKIKSVIDSANEAIISVECYMANSLPGIVIVGFANKSVNEAKERLRGALSKSGVKLPPKRIVFNLAPADLPKQGSAFDLAMLVSVLVACNKISLLPDAQTVILGELGLDGTIHPIRGVIGKILVAKKHGINKFWLPKGNLEQASLVPGIQIKGFDSVEEVLIELNKKKLTYSKHLKVSLNQFQADTNFDFISDQDDAKRCLVIAAAGSHNVFMSGPPGSGKSILAKALPSIMPSLSLEEILEVTHLHSLASKNFGKIIQKRPFQSPHHSASRTSIFGGGNNLKPGQMSLSHKGILFFDEFPEFKREVIELLRQPLEDKTVSVSQSNSTVSFPADFMFVAAANPCPCGFYGTLKTCICNPVRVLNYQKKISGPVFDRIDLYVPIKPVKHKKLLSPSRSNQTRLFKQQVENAYNIQLKRQGKVNSLLSTDELKNVCQLSSEAKKLLDDAAGQLQLSARGYLKSLKVARTIADLAASKQVKKVHVAEAMQYRQKAFG